MYKHILDDDGFALATVMGVIALISAVAIGGYVVAQNTLVDAIRVSDENRAYQAASSALEQELVVFNPQGLQLGQSPSGYAYGVKQLINGTDWYVLQVRDSNDNPGLGPGEYEMVATGGSGTATETVSVRFMSFNLWDMNVSGADDSPVGSGAGFNGNGRIIGKVYCSGDFEWSGNGSLQLGPLFVRNGTFHKQSSGSNVGSADDPVYAYFDNPPTGSTSNMYTEVKGSAPKLDIEWPNDSDMDVWEEWAENDSAANKMGRAGVWLDADNPGAAPRHPGAVSDAAYNVFNGDLTLGGTDFGKPGTRPDETSVTDEDADGDVIAVDGNTLFVNGVVFVDGTVTIQSPIDRYEGKGMIVARDGVVFNSALVPNDYYAGTGTLSPGDNVLMPVTSASDCLAFATMGPVTHNTATWICGAVLAGGKFTATPTGAKFRGSIIANGIGFNQPNVWLVNQDGLVANLPASLRNVKPMHQMNAESDWIRR